MKTEVKKKVALNTVPEAALKEAGLAKETILAAIPMDGVVLLTKDSMPIVELLQMLDRLNLYAAEMLAAVATECGPCEKADEALTVGTTRVRSAVSGIPTKRIVPVAPVAVITAPYSTPSTLIANSVMDANVWLTTLMR